MSTLTLSAGDRADLDTLARELADGGAVDAAWVDRVRDAWELTPITLRQGIRRYRRHSGPQGALLLRNLPVDESALPGTPSVAGSVQRTTSAPAAVLVLLACGLGDPIAYAAEKSGALVQDVVPVRGHEQVQGNTGSAMLSFHTENAFHPHRPDHLILLCLRADHDRVAGLRTASVRETLPLLDEDTAKILSSPEFLTAPPPSFGGGEGTEPHPVLHGSPEDPELRVDLAATTALTDQAAAALIALREAFARTMRSVRLVPGDLAVVDNRVAVHGRSLFQPRYDGRDRWLQRTFVAADLRRSRDHRPGDSLVLTR
ncbi:TauD/TfdA family dioxygenase [Allokutzneria albata]|uniref:L-asparagine oxygenase n=1 Tax=Allokutzneria albata TaxID=211114 RepID=A0A1G9UE34_ALLAB|nr:TauD/TfdA family dioxygenase [Allokutzneria albata]SDM58207.1 L-asparagine oxygenase [Allokutzneria albata]